MGIQRRRRQHVPHDRRCDVDHLQLHSNDGQNGYEHRAVFSNSAGNAHTTAATLTVTAAVTATASLSGSATTAASNYNLT